MGFEVEGNGRSLARLCEFILQTCDLSQADKYNLGFLKHLRQTDEKMWDDYSFFRSELLRIFGVRSTSQIRNKWLVATEEEKKNFSSRAIRRITAYYGYSPLEVEGETQLNAQAREFLASLPTTRGERDYVQKVLDQVYMLLNDLIGPDGVLSHYANELATPTGLREISQDGIARLLVTLSAEVSEVPQRRRLVVSEALTLIKLFDQVALYERCLQSKPNSVLDSFLSAVGRLFDFSRYETVKQHWLTDYNQAGQVRGAYPVAADILAAEPVIFDQWLDQAGGGRLVRISTRFKPLYKAVAKALRKGIPLEEVSDNYGAMILAPSKADLEAAVDQLRRLPEIIPGARVEDDSVQGFVSKLAAKGVDLDTLGARKLKIVWPLSNGHQVLIEVQAYCCVANAFYRHDSDISHAQYERRRSLALIKTLFPYRDDVDSEAMEAYLLAAPEDKAKIAEARVYPSKYQQQKK